MDANIWHIILFSLIGGVFSLAGGLVLVSNKKLAAKLIIVATPFAAGALLGAAFFDLLPEAVELGSVNTAFSWTLVGLVAFFVLERFIHAFHHEHEWVDKEYHHTIPLVVTSDTLHNAIDGVAIGAAFLVSVPTGIVTTIAVAAHEIPQEIGDFGLLIKSGLKRNRVILINIASAIATVPTAMAVFLFGGVDQFPLSQFLGLTAGFFIYIAVADLIPRIHNKAQKGLARLETIILILGIITIALVVNIVDSLLS
jgi:zinc and cadmium transporter